MLDVICNLDGEVAQRILETLVRRQAPSTDESVGWSPSLALALAQKFHVEPGTVQSLEGELARQALLVLAEDPETRRRIEVMAEVTSAQKFDFGVTIGVTAAVLIVLRTHVRFQRNSDGTWDLKLEKKPVSDALLKELVQKLISFAK